MLGWRGSLSEKMRRREDGFSFLENLRKKREERKGHRAKLQKKETSTLSQDKEGMNSK